MHARGRGRTQGEDARGCVVQPVRRACAVYSARVSGRACETVRSGSANVGAGVGEFA